MNDNGHALPWNERALVQEKHCAVEKSDASIDNGEMKVMWASSQGGCDPLKRLLRDVEKYHPLPPPSKTSDSSASAPYSSCSSAATVEAVIPLQGHSQITGASLTFLDSSSTSSSTNHTLPSRHRPSRRVRSSFTRGAGDNTSSSLSSSWISRGKLTNPSSVVLSRVSRTLNEKMMSESTSSQRSRMRKAEAPEKSLSQPNSSRKYVTPTSFSDTRSSNCTPRLQLQPEVLQPKHLVPQRDMTAPSLSLPAVQIKPYTTSITKSPRKARIKALLETIDHASPFPGHTSSSIYCITSEGHKSANHSRHVMQRDSEDKTRRPPPLRKSLALGMRRVIPFQPSYSSTPETHIPTVVVAPQFMLSKHQASSVEGILPSPIPAFVHAGSRRLSDNPMVVDGDLLENEPSSKQGTTRQRKIKGYRPTHDSPTLIFTQELPPALKAVVEIDKKGEDRLAQTRPCMQLCADSGDLSSTPQLTISGEEVEANISSDGASSYGDIDIDPTALEDACKMYDP